jgi:predicted aldo/keto reductase-like oxidoreductase
MKTIRLGKTGLEVSRLGMGGIPILRPPADGAVKVIQHALHLGINFIDTAVGYGDAERAHANIGSEERIGKAVANCRDRVFLATKTTGRDRSTALEHLELSLKRFNTKYIDLWQFHNISTFEEYERVLSPGGAMELAQEALKAGKIKHIGVSTHSLDMALKAVSSGHFETVQFPFNFINNEAAETLVPLAKKHDVGLIAMKPFAGGRLRDVHLAIKYLLSFGNVVPVPGVKTVEEIEEIVNIVNGSWRLTSEDRQEMVKIRAEMGTKFCQWCGYCQPCPQKVNIPQLMNARNINSYGEGFFSSVMEAVETAKNCINCGVCEEKCPFHLPIRETITKNMKFLETLAPQKGNERAAHDEGMN